MADEKQETDFSVNVNSSELTQLEKDLQRFQKQTQQVAESLSKSNKLIADATKRSTSQIVTSYDNITKQAQNLSKTPAFDQFIASIQKLAQNTSQSNSQIQSNIERTTKIIGDSYAGITKKIEEVVKADPTQTFLTTTQKLAQGVTKSNDEVAASADKAKTVLITGYTDITKKAEEVKKSDPFATFINSTNKASQALEKSNSSIETSVDKSSKIIGDGYLNVAKKVEEVVQLTPLQAFEKANQAVERNSSAIKNNADTVAQSAKIIGDGYTNITKKAEEVVKLTPLQAFEKANQQAADNIQQSNNKITTSLKAVQDGLVNVTGYNDTTKKAKEAVDAFTAFTSQTAKLSQAVGTTAQRTNTSVAQLATNLTDTSVKARLAQQANLLLSQSASAVAAAYAAILNPVQTASSAIAALHALVAGGGGGIIDRLRRSLGDAGDEGEKLNSTFKSLKTIITGLVIYRVFNQLRQALVDGVKEAVKLQKAIAEIQTISQQAAQSTEAWRNQLFSLSESFAVGVLDTANAAYQALSNQVTKAAGSFAFLSDALRFARITNTTATNSVNLLSSALNAFGRDATFANESAAQLFKVIELGRVRAGELGDQFGNVAILAGQLGVRLPELGAGIATISRQGVTTESTLTLLRNVFLKLVRPTEEMSELFAEWGVSTGEAAIKTFGFEGVLRKLFDEIKTGGSARLGELTGRVRALVGVLGLAGNEQLISGFAKDLKEVTNSLEDYNRAAAVTVTEGLKFEQETTRISNAFTKLGNSAAEFYNKIVGTGVSDYIDGITQSFQTNLELFRGALSAADLANQQTPIQNNVPGIAERGTLNLTTKLTDQEKELLALIGQQINIYNRFGKVISTLEKERQKLFETNDELRRKELQDNAEIVKQLNERRKAEFTITSDLEQRFPVLDGLLEREELTYKILVRTVQTADKELDKIVKIQQAIGKSDSVNNAFASLDNVFADLQKLYTTSQTAFDSRNYEGAANALAIYNDKLREGVDLIENDLIKANEKLRGLSTRQEDFFLSKEVDKLTDSEDKINLLVNAFDKLVLKSKDLQQQGDILGAEATLERGDKLIEQIRQISKEQQKEFEDAGINLDTESIADQLQAENFTNINNLLSGFRDSLIGNRESFKELVQTAEDSQLQLIEKQAQELANLESIDKLLANQRDIETTINLKYDERVKKRQQEIQDRIEALNISRAQLAVDIESGKVRGQNVGRINEFGGGRAVGGLIGGPVGRDNQLIYAHRNEMIMNTQATKRFYSQLVAMNAGQSPRGYANGGVVTNIGDINIQQAQNEGVTTAVREIDRLLKREVRRRNLR